MAGFELSTEVLLFGPSRVEEIDARRI